MSVKISSSHILGPVSSLCQSHNLDQWLWDSKVTWLTWQRRSYWLLKFNWLLRKSKDSPEPKSALPQSLVVHFALTHRSLLTIDLIHKCCMLQSPLNYFFVFGLLNEVKDITFCVHRDRQAVLYCFGNFCHCCCFWKAIFEYSNSGKVTFEH